MQDSKQNRQGVLVTDAWRAHKTYAKEKVIEPYCINSYDGKHVIKDSNESTKHNIKRFLLIVFEVKEAYHSLRLLRIAI
ncbi:hypothetical protein BSBH6_01060 [Bacillus subtilis]|nr:hypothetical protein BSBH6_01060 [Bacillus subtilis]RPK27422.1 hypothetical protein BH5_01058 [Bacillus subtilis]